LHPIEELWWSGCHYRQYAHMCWRYFYINEPSMNIKNSILLLLNQFVTLGSSKKFDRSESALHINQRCLMCFMEVQTWASLEVSITIANLFENLNVNFNKVWKTNFAKTLKVLITWISNQTAKILLSFPFTQWEGLGIYVHEYTSISGTLKFLKDILVPRFDFFYE